MKVFTCKGLYNLHYQTARYLAFKLCNKKAFYAFNYGNAAVKKTANDFFQMYNMGGEL